MRVIRRLGDGAHNDCVIDDDGDGDGEYDLEFHIASVFILLFVSFVGAAFSVVTTRVRCLRVSPIAINIGKFFGSGVVLATGFIHMLTSGMEALTNPCLPESWNAYGAYAGLFAMIAALVMHLIEFIAQQRSLSPGQGESTPLLDDKSIRYRQPEQIEISQTSHGHSHNLPFQDSSQNHKISTYLLEFGIALHSVLIGLALGTTTDSFEALLIALTFHQFFEAIALGAQIARVEHMSCSSTAFMVIFFSITTPLGIGIGIGIHTTTYDPDSASSLLINGIFDAISGGILIYVALVNLISAEMGPNAREFHSSSRGLKFVYFLALYTGAGAMAVIGLWA